MSKGDRIRRLLDHSVRHEQVEALVAAVREANPVQYDRRAADLQMGWAAPASGL